MVGGVGGSGSVAARSGASGATARTSAKEPVERSRSALGRTVASAWSRTEEGSPFVKERREEEESPEQPREQRVALVGRVEAILDGRGARRKWYRLVDAVYRLNGYGLAVYGRGPPLHGQFRS